MACSKFSRLARGEMGVSDPACGIPKLCSLCFSTQLPNGVQSPPGLEPRLLDPSIQGVVDQLTQDSCELHFHFPQLCTVIYLCTSSKRPCTIWLFLSSGKFNIVK